MCALDCCFIHVPRVAEQKCMQNMEQNAKNIGPYYTYFSKYFDELVPNTPLEKLTSYSKFMTCSLVEEKVLRSKP